MDEEKVKKIADELNKIFNEKYVTQESALMFLIAIFIENMEKAGFSEEFFDTTLARMKQLFIKARSNRFKGSK